eukprot:jgi/Pico_ML_1/55253/g976.t1
MATVRFPSSSLPLPREKSFSEPSATRRPLPSVIRILSSDVRGKSATLVPNCIHSSAKGTVLGPITSSRGRVVAVMGALAFTPSGCSSASSCREDGRTSFSAHSACTGMATHMVRTSALAWNAIIVAIPSRDLDATVGLLG